MKKPQSTQGVLDALQGGMSRTSGTRKPLEAVNGQAPIPGLHGLEAHLCLPVRVTESTDTPGYVVDLGPHPTGASRRARLRSLPRGAFLLSCQGVHVTCSLKALNRHGVSSFVPLSVPWEPPDARGLRVLAQWGSMSTLHPAAWSGAGEVIAWWRSLASSEFMSAVV